MLFISVKSDRAKEAFKTSKCKQIVHSSNSVSVNDPFAFGFLHDLLLISDGKYLLYIYQILLIIYFQRCQRLYMCLE